MTKLSLYLFQLHILKHEYFGITGRSKEIKDLELKIEILKKLYNTSIYKALTENNE